MFDLVIKNGLIVDGTGKDAYLSDIGICGDIITFIGQISAENLPSDGSKIIDAEGRVVTPGLIDPHTHVDQTILQAPKMEPYLKQGVTTVVTGNCGYGMAPQSEKVFYISETNLDFLSMAGAKDDEQFPLIFDRKKAAQAMKDSYGIDLDWNTFEEFNQKCDRLPPGCNVAPLIGYSALRTSVMGEDCLRKATEEEVSSMEDAVGKAMKSGAFGLSSGRDPVYLPGPYADDEEMHRMIKIVAKWDGIFASHTYNCDKDGNPDRIGGYKEMIAQAQNTGVKLNISHVHVSNMAEDSQGAVNAAKETLNYFDRAAEAGIDLTYDVIPSPVCSDFTMKSFGFYVKPLLTMTGTRNALAEKFTQPDFRQKIHTMAASGKLPTMDENSDTCWLAEFFILKHNNSDYTGKYMGDIAAERKISLLDTMMDLFAEDPDMIADFASPDFGEAVDLLCRDERAMPCSDGISFSKETNLTGNDQMPLFPNSMNVSCMPRYLHRYGAGCMGNFQWAIHHASGKVASRFGIWGRGVLKEGNFADIVIWNREQIQSFDEEENPLQDPKGIDYVIVNGNIAAKHNVLLPESYGRVLRKKAADGKEIKL